MYMEERRVKNSLDTAVEREQSHGNMVARYQDYYKFVIIKAMWHWPTDSKMDKSVFMTEGISQSRAEQREKEKLPSGCC